MQSGGSSSGPAQHVEACRRVAWHRLSHQAGEKWEQPGMGFRAWVSGGECPRSSGRGSGPAWGIGA